MELGSILATTAGTTAVVGTVARWRRYRAWTRALGEQAWVDVETGLAARHLSPRLAALVDQTRVLRLVLETPLRRFTHALLGDTPWRRRERCDEYDLALVNARRALWDWLRGIDALDAPDRAVLHRLGLSTRRLRGVLFKQGVLDRTEDPWEEVLYRVTPDPQLVSAELHGAMQDLDTFERALLGYRPEPYR